MVRAGWRFEFVYESRSMPSRAHLELGKTARPRPVAPPWPRPPPGSNRRGWWQPDPRLPASRAHMPAGSWKTSIVSPPGEMLEAPAVASVLPVTTVELPPKTSVVLVTSVYNATATVLFAALETSVVPPTNAALAASMAPETFVVVDTSGADASSEVVGVVLEALLVLPTAVELEASVVLETSVVLVTSAVVATSAVNIALGTSMMLPTVAVQSTSVERGSYRGAQNLRGRRDLRGGKRNA